jgi:hypothetical protein
MNALKELLIDIAEQSGIDPENISEEDMERLLSELSGLQMSDDPFYNAIIASIDRGNTYLEPEQRMLA